MDVLQSVCNEFSFLLRNLITVSPGKYLEKPEDKLRLFEGRSESALLQARQQELEHRYSLEPIRSVSGNLRYLETLAYLDFLEAFLKGHAFPEYSQNQWPFRWLDVGAKNWAYVEALYRFIERHLVGNDTNTTEIRSDGLNPSRLSRESDTDSAYHTKHFQLDGIELDPYRRYQDLHTRLDYAKAYTQALPNARYLSGDVLKLSSRYHVISHFLPFVVKDPCLAWGLPSRFFQPQRILNHLFTLLEPQGVMLILNQGQAEAEVQEQLLQSARQYFSADFSIEWTCLGEMPGRFIQYQYPRIGWLCQKTSL